MLPTIAVTTAQAIGSALLVVASLTFLGLGVSRRRRPGAACSPATWATSPSSPGRRSFPGLLIMLTVGALNLLADAIRDATPDGVRRRWLGVGTLAVAAASGLTGGGAALAAAPAAQDDVEPEPTEEARRPRPRSLSPTRQPPGRRRSASPSAASAGPPCATSPSPSAAASPSGLVGESGSGKTLTCRSVLGAAAARVSRSPAAGSGSAPARTGRPDRAPGAEWDRSAASGSARSSRTRRRTSTRRSRSATSSPRCCGPSAGCRRGQAHARSVELFTAVGLRDPDRGLPPVPARALRRHAAARPDRDRGVAASPSC